MASAREHFALDWIKDDLLETLNQARTALDDFAESGGDEMRLRACLTSLHQVHGTLVMLGLQGITLLADHLEQLAQAMYAEQLDDPKAAGQSLMQGILELPGYIDELHRGGVDSTTPVIPLVNEIRVALNHRALPGRISLNQTVNEDSLSQFRAIDGADKVKRMRSAYQNVLLLILKGEDRASAVNVLGKIASGLGRVCKGTPLEQQWVAFGEFVASLSEQKGAMEPEAVKLLRRVDVEIKNLAKGGEEVLRAPLNVELLQLLIEAADAGEYDSDTLTELRMSLPQDEEVNDTLAISGRQALSAAAEVLQEDLAVVKDKLDLLVRAGSVNLPELQQLTSPLKQIASTLSLLGFESSREIVAGQIDAIDDLVAASDTSIAAAEDVAAALTQVDENLTAVVHGSSRSEVEKITDEAQRQLLREARKGLDEVKQSVVDFVTAHWQTGHLKQVPATLTEICGALGVIPLPQPILILRDIQTYIETQLLAGHQPDWEELDVFADVVSAVDYYLERLGEEANSGSEDIIAVAQRSLEALQALAPPAPSVEEPVEEPVEVAAEELVEEQTQPALESFVSEDAPLEVAALEIATPEIETSEIETSEIEFDLEEDSSFELDSLELEPAQDAPLELESIEPEVVALTDDVQEVSNQDSIELGEVDLGSPEFDLDGTDSGVEEAELPLLEFSLEIEDEPAVVLDSVDDQVIEEAQEVDEAADDAIGEALLFDDAPAVVELEPLEFTPAAASASDSTGTSAERPDAEIVEIFVEEVGEVLETLEEFVPQWAQTLASDDALSEIRRAFHTLKGSGRIVGADQLGELSWSIENMLNRVTEGTVTPTAQFVTVINEACALTSSLSDNFANAVTGEIEPVNTIVERADLLSSGGSIEVVAPPDQASEEVVLFGDAIDAEEIELDLDSELPDLDDLAEMIGVVEFEGSVPEATEAEPEFTATEQVAFADESLGDEAVVTDSGMSDDGIALFIEEAQDCFAVIAAENRHQPWQISERLARAFHTLAGSAAIVGVEGIGMVVEPANQVAEHFGSGPASPELQKFFAQAQLHLQDFLGAHADGKEWEEPLEFVAQADDLIAASIDVARPIDKLLEAPATAALFAAEQDVVGLLAGQVEAGSRFTHTLRELENFSSSSPELNMAPVAQLAASLRSMLNEVPAERMVEDEVASNLLESSYETLIGQLNELAGGSSIEPRLELIDEMSALHARVVIQPTQELNSPTAQEVDLAPKSETETETQQPAEPTVAQSATALDPEELAEIADIDADLIDVFFEEAEEIGEQLEVAILSWGVERENRLYMENMLRSLHTLKGGARLCGLARLGDQAHEYESIVIEVQSNERAIDDQLFAHLHARYDAITEQVARIRAQIAGIPLPVASELPEIPVAPVVEPVVNAPPAEAPAAKQENVSALPVSVPAKPKLPAPMPKAAKQATSPKPADRQNQEMVRVSAGLLEGLVNLAGESSILRARTEQGMSDFAASLEEMETTIERLREQLRRLEIETETQILYRHERSEGPQYDQYDPLEMDRYSKLQQLSRGLSESASDMLDLKDTLLFKSREAETLLLQQARINTELQEGLMRTRMVPFNRLLPRLRRIVRQVSGELHKEVELYVQNPDGELDRTLLERMLPPLEHMLRNAVDHGIESPADRRAARKPSAGRIDLRLTREGGDVVIDVSDDGAGIDVEHIRAKAIERGLMNADADLSEEDVLQFVLAAGFSTAKSVTQISGRGVGLDVVHSEVKQLGGSVSIHSDVGGGTRFVIRVPFTVAINRALMVSVGDDQYAVPLNTIEGIVLVGQDQIQSIYNGSDKAFDYAGVPYQVRYLGHYLGREYNGATPGQDSVPVVLVRVGEQSVAIHVDQVHGSREIVVKSLGPQFAGVGGISGATILGDGSVVVILDLLALIRAQQRKGGVAKRVTMAAPQGPRCIMVVDDSVTVRKVTSRLLERQGMDVLTAKDGIEAVALLQEQRPDVMLLDIEMPRMDGFEVARQVRHDERLRNLPIIMISSRTGQKHQDHANDLGVNKFLGKPFQENELLACIEDLVSG